MITTTDCNKYLMKKKQYLSPSYHATSVGVWINTAFCNFVILELWLWHRNIVRFRHPNTVLADLPFLAVAVPDPAFHPGGKVIAVLAQRLLKLTWLWLWILTIRPLAVPRIFIKKLKILLKYRGTYVCLLNVVRSQAFEKSLIRH